MKFVAKHEEQKFTRKQRKKKNARKKDKGEHENHIAKDLNLQVRRTPRLEHPFPRKSLNKL